MFEVFVIAAATAAISAAGPAKRCDLPVRCMMGNQRRQRFYFIQARPIEV